jgi:hypothetical protein
MPLPVLAGYNQDLGRLRTIPANAAAPVIGQVQVHLPVEDGLVLPKLQS